MISIEEKEKCSGCSACAQKCPQKCIVMIEDSEGFLYPKINREACIDCGVCNQTCPILNKVYDKQPDKSLPAFVAYQNNETLRLASSSGGIFSVFANQILEEGGVIFGAAFNENYLVHHIAAENIKSLTTLMGSKYTQSQIDNTYREAKDYLDAGRKVLFSGTACQIAGLKSFLRQDYENLLTIDVLCHGVASPLLWKEYIRYQQNNYSSDLQGISFRDKYEGWKNYSLRIDFTNGRRYRQTFHKDPYMRLFLSNICLRPSCHHCEFKDFPRPSDITLGDCWGVEKHSPEMDDDKGTSVVIINTEKGGREKERLVNSCTWKISDLDTVLPLCADSRKSVAPHQNRTMFFEYLKEGYTASMLKMIEPNFVERIKRKFKHIKAKITR